VSETFGGAKPKGLRPQRRTWALGVGAAALIALLISHSGGGVLRYVVSALPARSAGAGRSGYVSRELFDSVASAGHRVGPPGARVTIVVFGTYGCGYCNSFSRALDSLQTAFPRDVAVVSYAYDPVLSRASLTWHLSAECAADQGRFGTYHRLLFAHLALAADHDGWLALADSAGIRDLARFYGCVRTEADRDRVVAATRLGERLGVRATPTSVINGTLARGSRSFAELAEFVTETLRSSDSSTARLQQLPAAELRATPAVR
jgi:protein-disulfide isomerase